MKARYKDSFGVLVLSHEFSSAIKAGSCSYAKPSSVFFAVSSKQ